MAHQDTRFPAYKHLNVTELYRDLNKFEERVKQQTTLALIVLRGLPGNDTNSITSKFPDAEVFNIDDFLTRTKDGKIIYNIDHIRTAHSLMRKQINKLLFNSKFNKPIIVNAPHSYLWELKYYKAKACQGNMPFIIYEARTLFSTDKDIRLQQLADINVPQIIGNVKTWLIDLKKKSPLLATQEQLLKHLSSTDPVKELGQRKDKTNSFCPSILLNIQLAAWLSSRCEDYIFMDIIWHFMQEWEEITNEESIWKADTPKWGW